MRVLVTGATGFVGRHLVPELVDAGHDVVAMTRRPERYRGLGKPMRGDVSVADTLAEPLDGADVAYYLVHSLDRRDFARRDAAAAEEFGAAAGAAGVRRIVYLGGLGDPEGPLSAHLRSRHEVEGLLAASGVPVTTLRAGIVVGDQGTSWEIIRRMVERVPVLLMPTWARTRTQPIALADVVRYLVGVLTVGAGDRENRVFEIGGTEVLRYTDLLARLSRLEGRPVLQVQVPLPQLTVPLAAFGAARVLPLLTGVDAHTVQALLASMTTEVVVRDDAIRRVVEFEPMDYDQAVLAALGAKARRERRRS